jgi:hypothetical protein
MIKKFVLNNTLKFGNGDGISRNMHINSKRFGTSAHNDRDIKKLLPVT